VDGRRLGGDGPRDDRHGRDDRELLVGDGRAARWLRDGGRRDPPRPRRARLTLIGPLALFRLGDFRCLAGSIVLNSVGMMGEVVVLGWLALELTNSPLLVGVAMGMRMLPLFFV